VHNKNNNNNSNNNHSNWSISDTSIEVHFGVINWRLEEIKQIDRKTRKILTIYKMHHPKADTDRLYVKIKEGGEDWYK
jgi:hypothetical protein